MDKPPSASVKGFLGLFAAFFALYALTAQRALGWGDSGEFQLWALFCDAWICGKSFSNAHPLYVALCRGVATGPFGVTLVSSFFGALAVGGFYLVTRRVLLSVLFGLSHMLWWLSCVAEVQTMSLALTAFETWCFFTFLRTRREGWLLALAFLSGLHLDVHNFALLTLPVFAFASLRALRGRAGAGRLAFSAAAFWVLGATPFLWSLATRGPVDTLVGVYGAKVAGLLPAEPGRTAANFALTALSFTVPALLTWWTWRARKDSSTAAPREAQNVPRRAAWILFAMNALFFVRYFVPDQATFLLPTLFFAYVLLSGRVTLKANRFASLAVLQILLPVFALLMARETGVARTNAAHPFRDEAAYFALPWKFTDDSADRCAALLGGTWTGTPETTIGKGKP